MSYCDGPIGDIDLSTSQLKKASIANFDLKTVTMNIINDINKDTENSDISNKIAPIKEAEQKLLEETKAIEDVQKNGIGNETEEERIQRYLRKLEIKHNSKKAINKKFKVGRIYILKSKGSKQRNEYKLIKFIYTVKDLPVNILVMKQISGSKRNVGVMSKAECKMFHIKYEPDLQIWPMNLNWSLKKIK